MSSVGIQRKTFAGYWILNLNLPLSIPVPSEILGYPATRDPAFIRVNLVRQAKPD
jgi:hypothetical protein